MSTAILEKLPIKIFADGADLEGIIDLYRKPFIKGLTTNPTLMRKVGITDYEAFARSVLESVTDKPISFEVFSDEFPEMRRQALKIKDWQDNVYVKIPITNTRAESAIDLIRDLAAEGVKLNVTAILTRGQVEAVAGALNREIPSVVSVFAGRVADTGVDPLPLMKESLAADLGLAHSRVTLGQRAGSVEYFPGGGLRLPYRHRSARHPGQGHQTGWDGSRRAVSRYRADVLRGCRGGRLSALIEFASWHRTMEPQAAGLCL